MKQFTVTITETLEKVVPVVCDSPEEAEQIVSYRWDAEQIILDASNFVDVTFTTEEVEK